MIIGDGACGKTSLLSVFTLGYFPTVRLIGFGGQEQQSPFLNISPDFTC